MLPKIDKKSHDNVVKNFLKDNRRKVFEAISLIILGQIILLVRPIVYMALIDRIVTSISISSIIAIGMILVFIAVFEFMAGILSDRLMRKFESKLGLEIGGNIWSRLINSNSMAFMKWRSGDVLERFQSINEIYNGYITVIFTLFITVPFVIAIIVIMMYINIQMFLLVMLSIMIVSVATYIYSIRNQIWIRDAYEANSSYTSNALDIIQNIDLIRSFNSQKFAINRIAHPYRESILSSYNSSNLGSYYTRTMQLVNYVSYAILMCLGAFFVISGKVTIGQLVAFDMLSNLLQGRIGALTGLINSIQMLKLSSHRLNEFIVDFPERAHETLQTEPVNINYISLKNINFSYQQDQIIKNINLDAKKGQAIGIIGPSGEGKSTLGKILCGLLEPDSGSYYVNGHVASAEIIKASSLYVPQDPKVFFGSVAENILMKKKDEFDEKDMSDLENAIKLASLSDFLPSLKDLMTTNLVDLGNNISGGQRQRLHIARAFTRSPGILVLDEPFSNIDGKGAMKILSNIRESFSQKIVFVITHQLEQTSELDRCIELNQKRMRLM